MSIKRQHDFLTKYKFPINSRPKFFSSKNSLKLTKSGFEQIKDLVDFREIVFEESLTVREFREACYLNQEVFYISPNLQKLYCSDKTFIALCTVFNKDKKAIF